MSADEVATEVSADEVATEVPSAQALPEAPVPTFKDGKLESFNQDDWERFADRVREEDPVLAASLDHVQVLSYDAQTILVGSGRSTHTIENVQAERGRIFTLIGQLMGPVGGFEVQMVENTQDTPFERREARRIAALKARREALANHPAVSALVERFGATLKRVELEEDEEMGR